MLKSLAHIVEHECQFGVYRKNWDNLVNSSLPAKTSVEETKTELFIEPLFNLCWRNIFLFKLE